MCSESTEILQVIQAAKKSYQAQEKFEKKRTQTNGARYQKYSETYNQLFNQHLYHRIEKPVESVLIKRLGSAEDVKDCYQEVMVAIYTSLHHCRFVDLSQFYGWVKRVANNKAIDLIRKKIRDQGVSGDLDLESIEDLAVTNEPISRNDPEENALKKEREEVFKEALFKAIETLPVEQRSVVLLYYLERISQSEISKMLDIPRETVRDICRRVLKKLQRQTQTDEKLREIFGGRTS